VNGVGSAGIVQESILERVARELRHRNRLEHGTAMLKFAPQISSAK
jgi:hypothetical protein